MIGRSEVISSFTNELPKTAEHYVNENNVTTGEDIYFIDRNPPPTTPAPTTSQPEDPEPDQPENSELASINSRWLVRQHRAYLDGELRNDEDDENLVFVGSQYFVITNTEEQSVLYFSVKGLDNQNEFVIRVYNESVQNSMHRAIQPVLFPFSAVLTALSIVNFLVLSIFN